MRRVLPLVMAFISNSSIRRASEVSAQRETLWLPQMRVIREWSFKTLRIFLLP